MYQISRKIDASPVNDDGRGLKQTAERSSARKESLKAQRVFEEIETAESNALALSQDVYQRWGSARSTHRFQAFKGKQLVAYRLLFQKPTVTNTLTCKGLDVSLDSGLSSLWERADGTTFWVSSKPVEVEQNCFLYMLKYTSLEYLDYRGEKSLKFSLCYKIRENPSKRVDGVFYLLEKAVFDTTTFDTDD